MGLFGKKSSDVPPDIGQEEKYDEKKGVAGKSDEKLEKIKAKDSVPQEIARETKPVEGGDGVSTNVALSNIQIESVNARIDSVVEWIKQFYDRFSYVSESIGEIRTSSMNNEKRISEEVKEANKVIDIVKEVKPEELRISYQKSDMKMDVLAEKIEANKLFMDEVMNEMNDLRRKSEVFVGTEGLMKLNNDTKKDLVEMQKINSKTRMQADKAQEIFMELRKGFADSQKVGAIVENLDSSYAGLKESIESLKLGHGEIVKRSDFLDFKKTYGNKLTLFDTSISDIAKIRENLGEMGDLLETSLSVSRRNEEDIGKVALKVGADDTKKVSDYENQMIEMVGVIETLSKQLTEVRKKVGLKVTEAPKVKKMIKPSDAAVEKVAAVGLTEVPKLKPKEFLGKRNIIARRGEVDMAAAKAKSEEEVVLPGDEKVEEEKPEGEKVEGKEEEKAKGGIGGMIKKIVKKVRPKEKEKKVEEKKERKKGKGRKKRSSRKKKRGSKKKGSKK